MANINNQNQQNPAQRSENDMPPVKANKNVNQRPEADTEEDEL